ncbi:MAG: hypothetical protein CR975_04805 [Gammaproteobacteria bacterium]|nr:MAG: hypothetical protein CR975_04805 [Gammaproteobacteria bacterium]
MKAKTKVHLALGAAALISGVGVSTAVAGDEDLGKCIGVNSCKGQTACKSADNVCAGQNDCKGKGWVKMDKKACEATKVGKFDPKLK